jgi:hypothetical protein
MRMSVRMIVATLRRNSSSVSSRPRGTDWSESHGIGYSDGMLTAYCF